MELEKEKNRWEKSSLMILILILKIINDRTIKIDFEEFSCLLNRRKTSNEKYGSVSSVNSRAFAAKSSYEISKFQLRARV